MKKVSIWMSAALMMLASCSQNEDLLQTDTSTDEEVRVAFSVQMPEMRTRATVPDESLEGKTEGYRYICEVYEGDNATGTPAKRFEQNETHFSMLLKKNTGYVFLLWADGGNAKEGTEDGNYYNADDLKNVQVAGSAQDKCDEIAFYACQSVSVTSTGEIAPITLNHAVAKVCLYETNHIEAGSTLSVEYTPAAAFNVATGGTTTATEAQELEYTLTDKVTATDAETGKRIAWFYMLAPEKGKAEGLSDITFTLSELQSDGSSKETENIVRNVPLQANYITNIRGEFSKYTSGTFNVKLDDMWEEGEDIRFTNVNMAGFSSEEELKAFIANRQGYLKFSGNITGEQMTWLKNALEGYASTPSYVLDMSDATLTDPFPTNAFRVFDGKYYNANYTIEGLILPNNLEELPDEALIALVNCRFVKFPASLKRIGKSVLHACHALEEVNLYETEVTVIPGFAFYYCSALRKIALGNVTKIESEAIYPALKDNPLSEIDLSRCEQVPAVTQWSFSGWTKKESLTIYVKNTELQAAFQASNWVSELGFRIDQFVVKQ